MHPDFSALEAYRDRIAGLFVTHGHEDHIGAIPYFLRRSDVPIWARRTRSRSCASDSPSTRCSARRRFTSRRRGQRSRRVLSGRADSRDALDRRRDRARDHDRRRHGHPHGRLQVRRAPPDGEAFDIDRFGELGDEGVALLMSDSTNIDARGEAGERARRGRLAASHHGEGGQARSSSRCSRRTFIACGCSAKSREHTKRKIVFARAERRDARERRARHADYLDWPSDLVLRRTARTSCRGIKCSRSRAARKASRAPRSRVSRAATIRNSTSAHGDTVVLSVANIPGNELEVYATDRAFVSSRGSTSARGSPIGRCT